MEGLRSEESAKRLSDVITIREEEDLLETLFDYSYWHWCYADNDVNNDGS